MKNKTNLPETSIEAYKQLTPEKLSKDYKLIIFALRNLKIANYDKIAVYLKLSDRNIVSRRLKEMMELGILIRMDSKSPTTRGRQAFNHRLADVFLNEDVSQISPELTKKQKKNKEHTQQELF